MLFTNILIMFDHWLANLNTIVISCSFQSRLLTDGDVKMAGHGTMANVTVHQTCMETGVKRVSCLIEQSKYCHMTLAKTDLFL